MSNDHTPFRRAASGRFRARPSALTTLLQPALLLAALLLAAAPLAALEKRSFRREFDLAAGETLRLANLAGSVRFSSGESEQAVVEVTVYAAGRDEAETEELLGSIDWIDSRDRKGRPEMALSYPVERYRSFHYPGAEAGRPGRDPGFLERLLGMIDSSSTRLDYLGEEVEVTMMRRGSAPTLYTELVVELPSSGRLAVRNAVGPLTGGEVEGSLAAATGSGRITFAGFTGELEATTGSGTVELGRVRGETRVTTGSGGIEVRELVGNGRLRTGSGSVRVHRFAAGELAVGSGSGRLEVRDGSAGTLEARTGSGPIRLIGVEIERCQATTGSGSVVLESSLASAREVVIETASGSVHIVGGPDAAFDLTARQGSGSLKVGYEDAVLRRRGHKVVGAERGQGGPKISVATGSGRCTIAPD